jgi:hypothetical protein
LRFSNVALLGLVGELEDVLRQLAELLAQDGQGDEGVGGPEGVDLLRADQLGRDVRWHGGRSGVGHVEDVPEPLEGGLGILGAVLQGSRMY